MNKTSYTEPIYYPCKFHVEHTEMHLIPMWAYNVEGISGYLKELVFVPCILTGWMQNEVHLQSSYQSLQ